MRDKKKELEYVNYQIRRIYPKMKDALEAANNLKNEYASLLARSRDIQKALKIWAGEVTILPSFEAPKRRLVRSEEERLKARIKGMKPEDIASLLMELRAIK